MHTTDPADVLERLNPDELAAAIAELDRQRSALIVLLRAARARQRRAPRPTHPEGGTHDGR